MKGSLQHVGVRVKTVQRTDPQKCVCAHGLSAGTEVAILVLLPGPNVGEQALATSFGALLWR